VPAVASSHSTPASAPLPPIHSRYPAATIAAISPAQVPSTSVTSAIGTARASTKAPGPTWMREIISVIDRSPKKTPFSNARSRRSMGTVESSQRRAYE